MKKMRGCRRTLIKKGGTAGPGPVGQKRMVEKVCLSEGG